MKEVRYLIIKVEENIETGKKKIEILREYKGHKIKCIQNYIKED